MKVSFITVIISSVFLSGCVAYNGQQAWGTYGYANGGNGPIQYRYGSGYWYDNNFDYYDGLYGEHHGGLYYVVRRDGNRYLAPEPRFPNPRFTQQGWPGYNPMNNGPWSLNNNHPQNSHHINNNQVPNQKPPQNKPNMSEPNKPSGPFINNSNNQSRPPQYSGYDKGFPKPPIKNESKPNGVFK